MQTQVKQGKGTADHLMPLGDWSEIYSPTPFTVRRQGGPLDPPDPPSRTPLLVGQIDG